MDFSTAILVKSWGMATWAKAKCYGNLRCSPEGRKLGIKMIKIAGGGVLLALSLSGVGTPLVFGVGIAWNLAFLANDLVGRYQDGNFAKCGTAGVMFKAVIVNGVACLTGLPIEEGVDLGSEFAMAALNRGAQMEAIEGLMADITNWKNKICDGPCSFLPCQDGKKPNKPQKSNYGSVCAWSCAGCSKLTPEQGGCGTGTDEHGNEVKFTREGECFNFCYDELMAKDGANYEQLIEDGGVTHEMTPEEMQAADDKFFCGAGDVTNRQCLPPKFVSGRKPGQWKH